MFDTNMELILKAKNGNKQAMSKIIDENIGLIWNIVNRFKGRGYDIEDLFQIGCVGFVKAIKRFNQEYDVKLSTYVVPVVIGEIKRFFRDDGPIKVSRGLKELSIKIYDVKRKYISETGEEPNINIIAQELNVSKEEIAMALDSARPLESISGVIESSGDGKETELIERLSDNKDDFSSLVDKITVSELISKLEKKEKDIIFLRYFKDKTQMEVAKILGISQVQVSRIEKRILQSMKSKIAS
jgi:RNA polymerase sigma-70 factor, sigma-B/F/G subfamily